MLVTLRRPRQVVLLRQWGAFSPKQHNTFLPVSSFLTSDSNWRLVSKDLGHPWILDHLRGILFVIRDCFKSGLWEQLYDEIIRGVYMCSHCLLACCFIFALPLPLLLFRLACLAPHSCLAPPSRIVSTVSQCRSILGDKVWMARAPGCCLG